MIDWSEVGDKSKYPLPSKAQLLREGMALDEDGLDMTAPHYGMKHTKAAKKKISRPRETNGNWKGGICIDNPEYWKDWMSNYRKTPKGQQSNKDACKRYREKRKASGYIRPGRTEEQKIARRVNRKAA